MLAIRLQLLTPTPKMFLSICFLPELRVIALHDRVPPVWKYFPSFVTLSTRNNTWRHSGYFMYHQIWHQKNSTSYQKNAM